MPLWLLILVLILMAAILYLALRPRPQADDRPDKGPYCQSWVRVDYMDDLPGTRVIFRDLKCNGQCPGGADCIPQHKDFEGRPDNLVKEEWCACPGAPEPAYCDLRRFTYRIGGQEFFEIGCRPPTGGCPNPGEKCKEVWRVADEITEGASRTWIVTCECQHPNDEPQ
jgi:hypothetical protein